MIFFKKSADLTGMIYKWKLIVSLQIFLSWNSVYSDLKFSGCFHFTIASRVFFGFLFFSDFVSRR